MTIPIRAKEVDPLSLEKSFKVADPKLNTGTNQKDYETFIRECQRTFETKPITYATDRAKILYAENFIDGTPANDWHRERPTLDQPSYTWEHMTHFLQEKLKPKHLRLLDICGQLKKLKQRPGQSVSELVSYLETLEDQLPERPSESQKHSNLLHSLHDYLERAIICANSQGKNRVELIEAARVAERVEPKPDFLRTTSTRTQYRSENGERSSRPSYARRSSTYMRTTSSKPDEPKNANTT